STASCITATWSISAATATACESMRICAWPCGQAQTPLLLRPSYDEERRRSRRTEGRPLSLSVQFSTARNVQFSAGVDIQEPNFSLPPIFTRYGAFARL